MCCGGEETPLIDLSKIGSLVDGYARADYPPLVSVSLRLALDPPAPLPLALSGLARRAAGHPEDIEQTQCPPS